MRRIVFLIGLIFTACGDIGEINIEKVDVNASLDAKADVDIDLSTLPNDLESNRDDFEVALESLEKTEYFINAPGLIGKVWECNTRFIDLFGLGQNLKFYTAVYSDGTGEAIPDNRYLDDYFLNGVFTWDKCEECVGEALSFRYNSVAGTGLVYAMELRGKVLTFYNYNPTRAISHEYEITTCKDITAVPEPIEKTPVPVSIDQTVGSYLITVSRNKNKYTSSTCIEWTQILEVTATKDSISMIFDLKGADSPPVVTGLYLEEFILNGDVKRSRKDYSNKTVIDTGTISFTGKIVSLENTISISGDLTTPLMGDYLIGTCSYTVSGNKKSSASTTKADEASKEEQKVLRITDVCHEVAYDGPNLGGEEQKYIDSAQVSLKQYAAKVKTDNLKQFYDNGFYIKGHSGNAEWPSTYASKKKTLELYKATCDRVDAQASKQSILAIIGGVSADIDLYDHIDDGNL